ncbi:hypothetical protein [Thalassococcus sp. S3]|uniref:hypothetical protein n=1 Tax=Thalassococcus sp. S3 TaxID=2017482 RepID=UPI00102405DF|nr:hypothetical protein [Thalassococcus sp. S3]QBF34040.1 hypothetical protein CFI11_22935 [Thalassococcus sp. S3]
MRAALLLLALGTAAQAGPYPYDGLYRPDADWAEGWDCQSVGIDGGALAVRGGQFFGVENTCTLSNPTQIRDMDATLYDATCTGEGMTSTERLMLMRLPDGLAVIRDGSVAQLRRCD